MPFFTTPERYGRQAGFRLGFLLGLRLGEIKGLRKALKIMLADKFGPAGKRLARAVDAVNDAARLERVFAAASKAVVLDEVRSLLD